MFPGGGEMSIRAQNGLQVFPGGGIVAVGEHFYQTILLSVFEKRKNVVM